MEMVKWTHEMSMTGELRWTMRWTMRWTHDVTSWEMGGSCDLCRGASRANEERRGIGGAALVGSIVNSTREVPVQL